MITHDDDGMMLVHFRISSSETRLHQILKVDHSSLPDRQLRKARALGAPSRTRSLPDRQLRKSYERRIIRVYRSLPDRQLRKSRSLGARPSNCSLPDRQLRKVFGSTYLGATLFTAG